jgi:transposase-like protein
MTRHSPEVRLQAIALATTIGPLRAAKQLGLPPRTVSYWMHQPAASPIIAAAERTMAERTVAAHEKALEAVEGSLTDPNARLGEKAQALRVLGEQAALAQGRATSNVAYSNVDSNMLSWATRQHVPLTDEQKRILVRHIALAVEEFGEEVDSLEVARDAYVAALDLGAAAPVAIAETAMMVTDYGPENALKAANLRPTPTLTGRDRHRPDLAGLRSEMADNIIDRIVDGHFDGLTNDPQPVEPPNAALPGSASHDWSGVNVGPPPSGDVEQAYQQGQGAVPTALRPGMRSR